MKSEGAEEMRVAPIPKFIPTSIPLCHIPNVSQRIEQNEMATEGGCQLTRTEQTRTVEDRNYRLKKVARRTKQQREKREMRG